MPNIRADRQLLSDLIRCTCALEASVAKPSPLAEHCIATLARCARYETIKEKISQAIAAAPPQDAAVREVQVYPSSGKLVIGLRIEKASDSDPSVGQWVYLSAAPTLDTGNKTVGLPNISAGAASHDSQVASAVQQLVAQLKSAVNIDYGISYQNLLIAANERLTRPLKDGFRMEGQLTAAQLDKVLLLADGILIALHASGDLKIVYGL